jgi:hypothetical protein
MNLPQNGARYAPARQKILTWYDLYQRSDWRLRARLLISMLWAFPVWARRLS